ncbi:MAG: hypothetical protein ABSD39_20695 [Terriglobales bacterium]|jgi:hypothetical protein
MANTFKSGDRVPDSGVYTVLHSTPHKLLDRQIFVEGARFRGCRICPLGVLYRLEEPCVPKVFPLMATQGWVIC